MHKIRDLLSSPISQKHFHGWATVFWFLFAVPGYYLHLLSSVTFVSFLSLYALAIGHFSSWQAAKVEVRQEEIEAARDNRAVERVECKVDVVAKEIQRVVPDETAKKTVEKLNGH